MKKIFLGFSLLAALALTSCSDFLDKEIEGYATDETFFQTQREIQEALNATYDILQSDAYNDQEWRFGEATADNVIGGDEQGILLICVLLDLLLIVFLQN